jgi:hypothetical protein
MIYGVCQRGKMAEGQKLCETEETHSRHARVLQSPDPRLPGGARGDVEGERLASSARPGRVILIYRSRSLRQPEMICYADRPDRESSRRGIPYQLPQTSSTS